MDTCILIPKRHYEETKNNFNYLKSIVVELSEDYENQLENIEDFAKWNLPVEIASSWDNVDYLICELSNYKVIDDEIASLLKQVRNNFYDVSYEGKNFNADIWTHEALKNNSFWRKQRETANKILKKIILIQLVSN